MRPTDLVARALERVAHAHAVLGPLEIVGITELSPCWRPLLQELTAHTSVSWTAGPRPTPPWLEAFDVTINRADPTAPAISTVSAATAYHEAIEAIRWARGLMASGEAEPADIGIAAALTGDYDDHLLALRADANLDLHYVHGIKVTTTRDGQAAAALADLLIRGFSQTRMRRLATLCGSGEGRTPRTHASVQPRGPTTRVAQAEPNRLSPRVRATASGRLAGVSSQPHGIRHAGRRSRRPGDPPSTVTIAATSSYLGYTKVSFRLSALRSGQVAFQK